MKIRKYPKGVGEYRDQHGKLRVRGRRLGVKPYYFKNEIGTAAFEEELRAWLDGAEARPKIGVSRVRQGSVSDVIARWYVSNEFTGFAKSTRNTFRGVAERFRIEHGDKPIADIEPNHIEAILGARAAKIGPNGNPTRDAANNLRKVLRMVMACAVREKPRKDNPALSVKKLKVKTDGFHSWTDDEIAQFEKAHAVGTRARLAFALLLYTAQRRSDVITMGKQHIRNDRITVRQRKTGTVLEIPVHPELAKAIAALTIDNMTLLTTKQGKPFTAPGFTNWFHDMCRRAELPHRCSPHGLRKAAARRLAEAGCSANQIAAITGHKTLSEVERYTRAAEQSRLAQDAMAAVVRADQEQNLANVDVRLAKTGGK